MPELPEVESIVKVLKPRLTNRVLEDLEIFWDKTFSGPIELIPSRIAGRTIRRVFRRGKFICLQLDREAFLTIHLRMSGRLVFNPDPLFSAKHERARFRFRDGGQLCFINPRKFGRIRFWPESEPFLPTLGPEPLDPHTIFHVLEDLRSQRAIKTILLDQHILAGLGNIYVDESLFAAAIHPGTPGNALTADQKKRLSSTIPGILLSAIRMRGTTLNDFRDPDQRSGRFQEKLQVYGRGGQSCRVCSTPIRRILVGQRGTHFCPECQKR